MIDADLSLADQLEAAADYLRVHGWQKRAYLSHLDGPACVVGALGQVLDTDNNWTGPAYNAVETSTVVATLADFVGSGYVSVWNDEQSSAEDVIDTLMELAAELRMAE